MVLLASRYDLQEILGEGASGTVHRAVDRTLGREVAIKLLFEDPTDDEDRALVLREARVAAHFRHPNTIEIYALETAGPQAFIVMELATGTPLDFAMTGAPLSHTATLAIGRALADVLAAAHEIGLVHRDVKPQNIIYEGPIDAPARIRLIDFGLAFLVAPPTATLGRLTAPDAMVGTPLYMAPEQCEAATITPAADVYALGCVLYEAATGRTPFVGNKSKILAGHMYLPPIPPSEILPTIAPKLDELLLAMLEKAPAARPKAAEVIRLLDAVPEPYVRSAAGSRSDRAMPASNAVARSEELPALGLLVPDEALAKALGALDIAITEGAEVSLVMYGETTTIPPGRIVVGFAEAPTPEMLKNAIRAGFAAVLAWPTTREKLAKRLSRLKI